MKRYKLFTTAIFFFSLFLLLSTINVQAQEEEKPRPSLTASTMQRIGVDTDITITYSRPGVKGRVIWGELVPFGMAEGNKYSENKPYPWRGGANESTTIEFNNDVVIEGNNVPAGKYSLHFIPAEEGAWKIMFNKNAEMWGSYKYNPDDDVLQTEVIPVETSHHEWLTYGFDNLNGTSVTAYLAWEKLKVPFEISTVE